MTHEAISRLETGTRGPKSETVRRLAAALGMTPDELVAGDMPEPPEPSGGRLTVDEAAGALGRSPQEVRDLIRRGKLAPAAKDQLDGRGPVRWLVDAEAVAVYRAPRHHAGGRSPQEPPPGFVSLAAFRAATGTAVATLHRRLVTGEIASVTVGTRRWIPGAELRRVLRVP